MSGGKSKSSSNSTQTITEVSASGVTTADFVLQGQTVSYRPEYGPEVASLVNKLVDYAGEAGSLIAGLAKDQTKINEQLINRSLTEVSDQTTLQTQPQLAVINKFIPFLMISTVGYFAYTIFKKR